MLRLENHYHTTVSAMIEWYHPNCVDGGDWEKKGWWVMQPGESKVAFGGDLDDVNLHWYAYAFATDGTFWGGEFQETVPSRAFQWCEHTSDTSSRTIGMFQFPGGQDEDHVIRFRG